MPASHHRRTSWCRLLFAAVAVAVLLGGCDLRRETAAPTPRSADAAEQARQRAAVESRDLFDLAHQSAVAAAEDLRPVLSRVGAHASAQLAQLGGVHVDPYATPTGAGPSATARDGGASTATPLALNPTAFVARLYESYRTTRGAAAAVTDGKLARLLDSISADRIIQAQRLAQLGAVKVPLLKTTEIPTSLPSGLAASAAVALVAAEDEAGYAFEVAAALRSGAARDSARARAAIHRNRAQAWAEAAGVATTSQDPRRAAYTIDRAAAATHLPADVESALAARYGSLVATLSPSNRAVMIDAFADCASAARVWGAPETAFPGLPERPADKAASS